ncbi:S-adenosyl-L-methionine-dependent methyltransferase [Mycena galopus ATCC 62051]|nr:S-adenosyl-L-methionine-dependent methyltransferase [Mycena galopus ATCC 62051]
MATFAQNSYDSGNYAASRPTYPRLLYDVVVQFHKEGEANRDSDRWNRAVDLGCGTGQATVELLANNDHPGFQNVLAVDPSSNMVEVGRNSIPEDLKSRLEFRQATAEDLSFIEDGTVDLITADRCIFHDSSMLKAHASAQCAHWFDWTRVWPELERILKPGGTFAFWGYSVFRLTQHPELTPLITAYAQGTDPETSIGPHWEPGRKIVDNHFLDVASPSSGWADLTRIFYTGKHFPAVPTDAVQDVVMRKNMTWGGGFANYLSTFSALHRYHDVFPADRERADGDIATRFRRTLMAAAGNPQETALAEVEWPMALVMVRKA